MHKALHFTFFTTLSICVYAPSNFLARDCVNVQAVCPCRRTVSTVALKNPIFRPSKSPISKLYQVYELLLPYSYVYIFGATINPRSKIEDLVNIPQMELQKGQLGTFFETVDQLAQKINNKRQNLKPQIKAFIQAVMKSAQESMFRGARKNYRPFLA